jgi:hypothetical protein
MNHAELKSSHSTAKSHGPIPAALCPLSRISSLFQKQRSRMPQDAPQPRTVQSQRKALAKVMQRGSGLVQWPPVGLVKPSNWLFLRIAPQTGGFA